MATSPAQLAANLAYFGPFMIAYGRANQATRDTVYAETGAYRAGAIDGATEVREVSATLGITPPPGY